MPERSSLHFVQRGAVAKAQWEAGHPLARAVRKVNVFGDGVDQQHLPLVSVDLHPAVPHALNYGAHPVDEAALLVGVPGDGHSHSLIQCHRRSGVHLLLPPEIPKVLVRVTRYPSEGFGRLEQRFDGEAVQVGSGFARSGDEGGVRCLPEQDGGDVVRGGCSSTRHP